MTRDVPSDHESAPIAEPLAVRVADVMRLTGLGQTKVYELMSDGTLQTVLVGRCRLVLYRSLKTLLGLAGDQIA